MNKNKIFAIHTVQKELVQKYCFDKCGEILFGGLMDKELGEFFPCDVDKCPFEEKRAKLGKVNDGREVWIRKLIESEEKLEEKSCKQKNTE